MTALALVLKYWRQITLGALALIVGLTLTMKACGSAPPPKIPPKTQHSIDSLEITKPAFDSVQAAQRQAVARDTTVALAHHVQAGQASRAAVVDHAAADSLAVIAAARHVADSIAVAEWKAAYDQRTDEAAKWRKAALRDSLAYVDEHTALERLRVTYATDTLRRIAIEVVNDGLRDAIKHIQQPCTIIGPIPCPSRTVTMIGSVILAGVASQALRR